MKKYLIILLHGIVMALNFLGITVLLGITGLLPPAPLFRTFGGCQELAVFLCMMSGIVIIGIIGFIIGIIIGIKRVKK